MEVKDAGKVKTLFGPTMTDAEYKALAIVVEYVDKMLMKMDIQNPNYPYLNATNVDLCRMYGRETVSRNAVNSNSKQ